MAFSGMLVKELAVKSGVNKYSLDNYLNTRGQIPSIEAGYRIAHALGVSVEYLITGEDGKNSKGIVTSDTDIRIIARLVEQLDEEDRIFVIDFLKWLKTRK